MRTSSMSFARTSRAPSMLITCRSSTSLRSRISPGRRWKCWRSIRCSRSDTRPAAISEIDVIGTKTCRPATSATTPLTGGYSSPSSRTIRSSIRPSRSPAESRSAPPTTNDRCKTSTLLSAAAIATPPRSQPSLPAEEAQHPDEDDQHQADGDDEACYAVEPGEVHVHAEEAGDERQRQHDDAEDREHVQDVVLLM